MIYIYEIEITTRKKKTKQQQNKTGNHLIHIVFWLFFLKELQYFKKKKNERLIVWNTCQEKKWKSKRNSKAQEFHDPFCHPVFVQKKKMSN